MLRVLYETISKRENLHKYDLIVVGNLTAGYFAREFHKHTRDIYSILLINNQMRQEAYSRIVDPSDLVDGTSVSVTNGIALKSVNFDLKSVTLNNGRNINYERIVIAQELQDDSSKIEGLEDALRDLKHPVFSKSIDFNFKDKKPLQSLYKAAAAGDIYYYIPKFPFNGQEDLVTPIKLYEALKKNNNSIKERLNLNYHIVTPNEHLFPEHFQQQQAQYTDVLKSLNINLHTQTQILKIDKSNRMISLKRDNHETQHEYDAVFLQGLDSKSPQQIQGNQKTHLHEDVNPQTLQHKKYPSVFCLGAPMFNTYYTTEQVKNQIQLAKINVLLSLQGQKCKETDTSSQQISYYIGNNKTAITQTQSNGRFNKLVQNVENSTISQHIRYFWQSQLKNKLLFMDDLQQSLIFNRIYGRFVAEGQKEAVNTINQQRKHETQLSYAIERRPVDTIAIREMLQEYRTYDLVENTQHAVHTEQKDHETLSPKQETQQVVNTQTKAQPISEMVEPKVQMVDTQQETLKHAQPNTNDSNIEGDQRKFTKRNKKTK